MSLALLVTAAGAQAAPVDPLTDAIANALATAKGAWTESLLQPADQSSAYDEQIFTELSPILDGLELAVRLKHVTREGFGGHRQNRIANRYILKVRIWAPARRASNLLMADLARLHT